MHPLDRFALVVPLEDQWDGTGPMPTRFGRNGRRVPDLPRIRQERWPDVLLPLDRSDRLSAVEIPELGSRICDAIELCDTLPPPIAEIVHARLQAGPPTVARRLASRRRSPLSTQLNMRLSREDHRRLSAVAELTGGSATGVARQFVLAGIRQTLVDLGPDYVRLVGLEEGGAPGTGGAPASKQDGGGPA